MILGAADPDCTVARLPPHFADTVHPPHRREIVEFGRARDRPTPQSAVAAFTLEQFSPKFWDGYAREEAVALATGVTEHDADARVVDDGVVGW